MFPIFNPTADNTKVVTPIKITAKTMFTCKNANVTPMAKASMLVATAKGSMAFAEKEPSSCSSSPKDSRIMFPPISASSPKAIQ